MLCLTRRPGQKIIVAHAGVRYSIEVEWIEPNKVRLAFDAPNEVRIDREEIWLQKQDDIASTICSMCFGGKEPDEMICEGCRCGAEAEIGDSHFGDS